MCYHNIFLFPQNKFLFNKIYLYDFKKYFQKESKEICNQKEISLLYNFFSSN